MKQKDNIGVLYSDANIVSIEVQPKLDSETTCTHSTKN